MPAERRSAAPRRGRRLALLALAVLAALTALSWWLSGRWLARPEPAPEPPRTGGTARP